MNHFSEKIEALGRASACSHCHSKPVSEIVNKATQKELENNEAFGFSTFTLLLLSF